MVTHDLHVVNANIDTIDDANMPYEIWAYLRTQAIEGQNVHVERSPLNGAIMIIWQAPPAPFNPRMSLADFALLLSVWRDRRIGEEYASA